MNTDPIPSPLEKTPTVKDTRQKRKARRKVPKIYLPPALIIGELFVFKGYFWKLVAGSPDGGSVTLIDQKGHETKGASDNALLVLERGHETGQHLKKRMASERYNKRNHLTPDIK